MKIEAFKTWLKRLRLIYAANALLKSYLLKRGVHNITRYYENKIAAERKHYNKTNAIVEFKARHRQLKPNYSAKKAGIDQYLFAKGPAVSPYYVTVHADGSPWLELRTLFAQEMIKQGDLMPWLAISFRHGEPELTKTKEALATAMAVCARGVSEGVDKYLVGPAIKPVFRRFN